MSRLLVLAVALSLIVAPRGGAFAAGESWSSTAAGFRVDWTDDDITVVRNSDEAVSFSARKMAEDGFRRVRQAILDIQPDAATIVLERKISVMSLAGSLLALRDEGLREVAPAGAATAPPTTSVRYWTIDMRKPIVVGDAQEFWLNAPGPLVSLRDLAPDTDLLAALQTDRVAAKQVEKVTGTHDALEPFIEALTAQSGAMEACKGIGAVDFTRFAVQSAQKDRVAVRLGIARPAPTCPDNVLQLGLYVPNRGTIASVLGSTGGMVRLPSRGMVPVVFSYRQGAAVSP